MITDKFENLLKYHDLIPNAGEIFAFLRDHDLFKMETGKYLIPQSASYVLVQEYLTKPEEEKKWESHIKYLDIQIVLNGEEYIGYSPVHLLTLKDPYRDDKDVIHYDNTIMDYSRVFMPANYIGIFFPEDGHKPGCHMGIEKLVKKAVIKVFCG